MIRMLFVFELMLPLKSKNPINFGESINRLFSLFKSTKGRFILKLIFLLFKPICQELSFMSQQQVLKIKNFKKEKWINPIFFLQNISRFSIRLNPLGKLTKLVIY
jgi:hypothetical protein